MKAKMLLLIFSFIIVSLSAQNTYIRNIPIQLPLTYLFDPQYTPKQIYPTPDGGMIILGDCLAHYGDPYNPGLAADCGAIKLDANGNCEWQWWSRDFIGIDYTHIIGIDQEVSGRVNILINAEATYNQIGWINPDGSNNLQYIQLPTCILNRAFRLSNNDIFSIGSMYRYNPLEPNFHNTSAAFIHLSPQGDTLSIKTYLPDSIWVQTGWRLAEAYDMEMDTDGMLVSTCQFTDRYASVVKTDWDGNIIWRRDTNTPLCIGRDIPITKIPLTTEIVFGYQVYNNNYRNQFSIFKITNTGLDSLYSIQMSDTICVGSYYSIVGYRQGIYLSGFYGDFVQGNYDRRVHISNYGLQGQCNWDWSILSPLNYEQPTDCITVLPDSSIVHVFGNWQFGDFGLTVVKLTPDGTEIEDETIPLPDVTLCAYPNPIKDNTNIRITYNNRINEKNLTISIYNVKGQLVKNLSATSKTNGIYDSSWDGKDEMGRKCASGTYILNLKSDNKHISKKILLVK